MTATPELKGELETMARQLRQQSSNARMGGKGVAVRVIDPDYLIDLLERAARQV